MTQPSRRKLAVSRTIAWLGASALLAGTTLAQGGMGGWPVPTQNAPLLVPVPKVGGPMPNAPKANPSRPEAKATVPREAWATQASVPVFGSEVLALACNPNGPLLAVAGGGGTKVALLHATSGMRLGAFGETLNRTWVQDMAWSPDGETLAMCGARGADPILWLSRDEKTAPKELKGHTDRITSVAWHYDSSKLATGSWDGTVAIWEAETGERLFRLAPNGGMVYDVAYGPGARVLAVASEDGVVRVWKVDSAELSASLRGHVGAVQSVAFGGEGRRWLASGGNDGTVRIWDGKTKTLKATGRGHKGQVWEVEWSPDGAERLASCGEDGTVRFWNADGREVGSVRVGKALRAIAWSPDGTTLAVSDVDGAVTVVARQG